MAAAKALASAKASANSVSSAEASANSVVSAEASANAEANAEVTANSTASAESSAKATASAETSAVAKATTKAQAVAAAAASAIAKIEIKEKTNKRIEAVNSKEAAKKLHKELYEDRLAGNLSQEQYAEASSILVNQIKQYQAFEEKKKDKKVNAQLGRAQSKNQARQVLQEWIDKRNDAKKSGVELTKQEKAEFEAVATALVAKIAEYKALEKTEKQQEDRVV